MRKHAINVLPREGVWVTLPPKTEKLSGKMDKMAGNSEKMAGKIGNLVEKQEEEGESGGRDDENIIHHPSSTPPSTIHHPSSTTPKQSSTSSSKSKKKTVEESYCPVHKDEFWRLYCVTCRRVGCGVCFLAGDHAGRWWMMDDG